VRNIGLFLAVHGSAEGAGAKVEVEDKTASLYAALLNES
jgi:hypothetical protein